MPSLKMASFCRSVCKKLTNGKSEANASLLIFKERPHPLFF